MVNIMGNKERMEKYRWAKDRDLSVKSNMSEKKIDSIIKEHTEKTGEAYGIKEEYIPPSAHPKPEETILQRIKRRDPDLKKLIESLPKDDKEARENLLKGVVYYDIETTGKETNIELFDLIYAKQHPTPMKPEKVKIETGTMLDIVDVKPSSDDSIPFIPKEYFVKNGHAIYLPGDTKVIRIEPVSRNDMAENRTVNYMKIQALVPIKQ